MLPSSSPPLDLDEPRTRRIVDVALRLAEDGGFAAVRLREGAQLTEDELKAWAESRMARYKAPRHIVFVDELPRTGTRKVQRAKLTGLFEHA